mgnify:CR=1 FL=1
MEDDLLRIFGGEAYFSVDYGEQSVHSASLVRTATGVEIAPRIIEVVKDEPLRAALAAFVAACRGENSPYVDGRTGAAALAARPSRKRARGRGRVPVVTPRPVGSGTGATHDPDVVARMIHGVERR